ncbi:MAG: hypothetical protein IJ711_00295 [Lachnospiraceae bacterium]|nr:hypothetical protein [Clostridia bacterium]MBR1691195.1 hypothetical protein [Lachnospiraceae bacterium]
MKFYDIDGNELADKDSVDYSTGRYLQDENDPDKYIFSPWGSVPARDEENQPDNSIPTNAEIAAAIEELAEIVAGMEG